MMIIKVDIIQGIIWGKLQVKKIWNIIHTSQLVLTQELIPWNIDRVMQQDTQQGMKRDNKTPIKVYILMMNIIMMMVANTTMKKIIK